MYIKMGNMTASQKVKLKHLDCPSHIVLMCVQVFIFLITLVLICYLMLCFKKGVSCHNWQLSPAVSQPCVWTGQRYCGSNANSLLHRLKRKIAATILWIFWLHFCTLGGSKDVSCIFIVLRLKTGPKLS